MGPRPLDRHVTRITDLWLTLSVHFDAFRFDRRAYLTVAKWWVMRKRVRARGQLAPLLSQSPRAYTLWALREAKANDVTITSTSVPPIIALVQCAGRKPGNDEQLAITLNSLAGEDITALTVGENEDIAAVAKRIDWTTEPWLLLMVAGDKLARGGAQAYRTIVAQHPASRLLYADDDLLDRRGRRVDPHFKPDWNSELFQHFDYLTGACILRAQAADLVALSGHADWAARLVSRVIEEIALTEAAGRDQPFHVRQMLHHRAVRIMPRATLPAVPLNTSLPPVTIIVPTRNRVDLLSTCMNGIAATNYSDMDVIVVDNDSDDPDTLAYLAAVDPRKVTVLRHAGPFNYSAINNRAASIARGRLLCLLNNDVEVVEPDWLAIMASQAMREDVGAVGARLLYPDGRTQHAGVVIGVGNAAGHAHRFVHPDEEGYFRRHALPQFATAVTAACLVVQRERFMAVGGLDERHFAVAFNDVDLCLRLNQRGWQSFYEPRATLIHHESVSRGLDQDPIGAKRFAGELAALKRIWKTDEIFDPYHHPRLSRAAERFAVAL